MHFLMCAENLIKKSALKASLRSEASALIIYSESARYRECFAVM